MNSSLTDLGRSQAAQQAKILSRTLPNSDNLTYLCSPLPRAQETAEIALNGVEFITDLRLRELSCGRWEGLSSAEREANDPVLASTCTTDWDLYQKAPGGEGIPRLEERLRDFINDISGTTVIVAHKVVLTVLRGLLTATPRSQWHRIEASQGTVIKVTDGTESILR